MNVAIFVSPRDIPGHHVIQIEICGHLDNSTFILLLSFLLYLRNFEKNINFDIAGDSEGIFKANAYFKLSRCLI